MNDKLQQPEQRRGEREVAAPAAGRTEPGIACCGARTDSPVTTATLPDRSAPRRASSAVER